MPLGGILLAISSLMYIFNLLLTHLQRHLEIHREVEFAQPIRPVLQRPPGMNGFALLNWILVVYMAAAFGYPVLQFFLFYAVFVEDVDLDT